MIEKHQNLGQTFLKKGAWLYFFAFIGAPLTYIIKITLSGTLSVSEMGILYGIISLLTILTTYSDFGMGESLKYFLPRFIEQKKYSKVKSLLVLTFLVQIITGTILTVLFYFGADLIGTYYLKAAESIHIIKIFCLFFMGVNFLQICINFFMAVQNTFWSKFFDFFRFFLTTLSVLYILYFGTPTLEYFSWGWIISLYLTMIPAVCIFIKKYYGKFLSKEKISLPKTFIKKIFSYSFLSLLGAQAFFLLSQIDMQMVLFLLGTEAGGYYTNYLSIIVIPFVLLGPIFMFLLPVFSQLFEQKETQKIIYIKDILTKIFIGIGVFLSIFMFLRAETISTVLFGNNYIFSGEILRYSVLFLIFNLILQINFNIFSASGRLKTKNNILIGAVIFNTLANFILIKSIGAQGSALATGFGWVLIFCLGEYFIGKEFRTRIDIFSLGKNIVFFGILGYIFHRYIEIDATGDRFKNLIQIFIEGFIFLGFFMLLNFSQLKNFYKTVKKARKG